MIIDPRPMELTDWVNAVTFSLRRYGMIPQLVGLDWKEWARRVLSLPTVAEFQPPLPDEYDDWREWAVYFNDALSY